MCIRVVFTSLLLTVKPFSFKVGNFETVLKSVAFIVTHHNFVSCAVFAWEAYEKGADVHLQADPTKLELLHKEYKVKKEDFKEDQKLSVVKKVSCTLSNITLRVLYVLDRLFIQVGMCMYKSDS